jgi:hypothetical protein
VSVVETQTFRLPAGADPAALLASDKRVQTELVPNQPGFIRRTTARRGDAWLVVTLWGSEDAAAAFGTLAGGHPVQAEFLSHLEPGSLEVHRYETLD